MEKEYIPYEQALALKELGFDEPCFKAYFNYTNTINNSVDIIELHSPRVDIFGEDYLFRNSVDFVKQPSMIINHNPISNKNCSTPLYQQAFRWFREKYKLNSTLLPIENEWYFLISKTGETLTLNRPRQCYRDTYEEAELECLKKLIQIVKEQE